MFRVFVYGASIDDKEIHGIEGLRRILKMWCAIMTTAALWTVMLRASGISQSSAIRTTISFQRHRALVSPLYVRTFQLLSILLFCQTRARIYLVSPLFASSVARFLLQQMQIMGHHAILLSYYSHPDGHPPNHFSLLLRPHRTVAEPGRDDCSKSSFTTQRRFTLCKRNL